MNLVSYVKSGYPILYLLTAEEGRAERTVLETANVCKRRIVVWSFTEGFTSPDPKAKTVGQCEDPIQALAQIEGEQPGAIFVFRDFHNFLENPKVKRHLRDIARDFKQRKKTLIIISAVNKIPPELERDIALIEFSLPTQEEIKQVFTSLYSDNKKIIGEISDDDRERIIQAAMGLTTVEAENAFAKAIVDRASNGKDEIKEKEGIAQLVLAEKARAVGKTGILEYFHTCETAKDIGGLDNLKKWMEMRSQAFSKKAREFGLPMPRGILLVGLPGCGKSLSAKAASNILGVPLLKFDIGRVFGGLVGQSEQNMRIAIQTAEAIGSCVLWIDEMEKAFAGMMGSGSGDSGVSQRVFGNFITWMQEKKCPVFVVSTVNRIDGLPPELLRKGRFDEIFFVGLPSQKEREEIFKIHVSKYRRDPEKFDLKKLAGEAEEFSGAEIEEAVISGLYQAFHHDRDLKDEDVVKSIKNTNPLARSRADQLKAMAKWAEDNAVNASVADKTDKKAVQAGRQLEL